MAKRRPARWVGPTTPTAQRAPSPPPAPRWLAAERNLLRVLMDTSRTVGGLMANVAASPRESQLQPWHLEQLVICLEQLCLALEEVSAEHGWGIGPRAGAVSDRASLLRRLINRG